MMQEHISPEEKLLNLIKRGDAANKPDKPLETVASVVNTENADSVKRVNPKKTYLSQIPRKTGKNKNKIFSMLNKAFIAITAMSAVYLLIGYLYPYKGKEYVEKGEINSGLNSNLDSGVPAPMPSISKYTDVLGKRQMFKIYETPAPKPTEPTKPKVTLQQIIAGYTFVGILFGDEPQAIVEDKKSGQSFYLKAGQNLGEIKIESVERGKVTLSCGDEVMDINI